MPDFARVKSAEYKVPIGLPEPSPVCISESDMIVIVIIYEQSWGLPPRALPMEKTAETRSSMDIRRAAVNGPHG
jgi:hypothetical protein